MGALWGTIVNVLAVAVGGTVGLLLNKGIPERITKALMVGVGLATLYIGIDGCLAGEQMLITVISLAVGAVVGELLDLDGRLERMGLFVEKKLAGNSKGESSVAKAFVNASLLFCVGTMTIVGSLQSGLTGDHETLYLKSVLDLISSMVFGATLGWGVLLSCITILVYQGGIALLAQVVEPFLSEAVVAEMTCVGSLLIVALALNILNITKIKVANFLPAILIPLALCPLFAFIF